MAKSSAQKTEQSGYFIQMIIPYSPGRATQDMKAIPICSTKCFDGIRQSLNSTLDLMKLNLPSFIMIRLFEERH
ncbi:hypothetical protein TNCV_1955791 [Trichonephila clavipes]|nr:hypothetical protein TNCV_1955791 [Trichonephila clavipes]